MSEEEVGQLIEGICEDYSAAQLDNEVLMLRKLRALLGLKRPVLRALLKAAREVKQLRGDIPPCWAQFLRIH